MSETNRPETQPEESHDGAELGLEGFAQTPDEEGLSLDQLSEAYAQLLGAGEEPYDESGDEVSGMTASGASEKVADADCGETDDDSDVENEYAEEFEEEEETAEEEAEEEDADHACEISPLTILEAMLFVGRPGNEPLSSREACSLMRGVRAAEVDELVNELNDVYRSEGRPYKIVSVAGGYRIELHETYQPLREKMHGRQRTARLSQAAIDVLAIVGYNQPVTKDAIDELRGKSSSSILSQLVRRQLLELEIDPHDKASRQYRTTDRFLGLFGLADLSELPRSEELEKRL